MAQIVQPNINAIGGGSTPTQVGAVVFDKPQYDPLTIQMKVMGDLDDWADKKRAEQAAVKQEIDKIADFSIKDILDKDTDYFLQGKNKLIDAQAELGKYKYGSPEYKLALENAKRERAKYELGVEASIMHRKRLEDYAAKFDPSKHDQQTYLDWVKRMVEAPSLEERIKISSESPLTPKKSTLEELTLGLFKDAKGAGLIEPTKIKKEYGRTPDGEGILIETTEVLPEEKSLDFAQSWIGNANVKDQVFEKYSQLSESEQQYYLKRAQELSQQYSKEDNPKVYSPYDVYYSQTVLDKYNTLQKTQTQLGYSPQQQQKAQYEWSAVQQDPKKVGEGLVKLISGIKQGKPQYLQPAKLAYGGRYVNAVRAKGLNGYRLGTYQVKDEISQKVQILPNEIKDVLRMPDGRIMVMTSETYNREYERVGGDESKMEVVNLYTPFTSATQLYNSIVTGHYKGQGDEKIRTSGLEWVKENVPKAYLGATGFDDALVAPLSEQEQKERDIIYGKKVVRKTEELPKEVGATQIFKGEQAAQKGAQKKPTEKAEELRKKYNY